MVCKLSESFLYSDFLMPVVINFSNTIAGFCYGYVKTKTKKKMEKYLRVCFLDKNSQRKT